MPTLFTILGIFGLGATEILFILFALGAGAAIVGVVLYVTMRNKND